MQKWFFNVLLETFNPIVDVRCWLVSTSVILQFTRWVPAVDIHIREFNSISRVWALEELALDQKFERFLSSIPHILMI